MSTEVRVFKTGNIAQIRYVLYKHIRSEQTRLNPGFDIIVLVKTQN